VNNHRLYGDGDKFEKLMLGAPYSRPLDSKGSYYAKPYIDDRRVLVDYEVTSIDDLEETIDHLINQIDNHKGTELYSSILISSIIHRDVLFTCDDRGSAHIII